MESSKICSPIPGSPFQSQLVQLTPKSKSFVPIFCSLEKTSTTPRLQNQMKYISSILSNTLNIETVKNSILNFFSNIIEPPLDPTVNPMHVFKGNLAPVEEMEPTICQVIEGELPFSLNGFYIRNGPNPKHQARRALHLFEGDGMLHSLRISNGCATYCNRYIKTYKYMLEQDAGFPIFPNMLSGLYGLFDIFSFFIVLKRIIAGNLDLRKGIGVANTSLAYVSGKLFALCESDLPYIVNLTQQGDIETLGRWEFDGKRFLSNMTAHPKFDMETKETFAFSWSFAFPHLTFFRIDEKGVKQKGVPIFSIHEPSLIHDFAITKRFAIFHESQLIFSLPKVLTGRGAPLVYKPNKSSRIGIISKYAKRDSDMKWFEIPGFNVTHIINAWENGDEEIVLVASNVKSVENFLNIKTLDVVLEKIKINTKTGNVCRNILSKRNLDLGSINTDYLGKKTRYAYLGVLAETPKTSGLVKIDLETGNELGRRFYGPNCFGGEPLFVRRLDAGGQGHEDDGFVMTYVHNELTDESKFLLMDAKSPNFSTIAAVKLPRRVPYGFHGLFLNDWQINQSL